MILAAVPGLVEAAVGSDEESGLSFCPDRCTIAWSSTCFHWFSPIRWNKRLAAILRDVPNERVHGIDAVELTCGIRVLAPGNTAGSDSKCSRYCLVQVSPRSVERIEATSGLWP
jgi:hypothetical protein